MLAALAQGHDAWVARLLAEQVERAAVMRAVCLYVPVVLCVVAYLLRGARVRSFASPLLSLLWTLPALLLLQRLNLRFEWWTFDTQTACVIGMPVALYLGWAVFWGLLPQLVWPRMDVLSVAIVAFSFDFVVMIFLSPALVLNHQAWVDGRLPTWLIGELVGISLVLVPAMLLFRWTEKEERLGLRAAGQVVLAGLVFLYLLPEIVFALRPGTAGWGMLGTMPRFELQLWVQVLLVLAVPGVSAVQEFVQRGGGTPLPYDPPRRLVVSGVYRYCANPMQFSCALVMLAEAGMLRSPWLVAGALLATIYSAGLAHWDEAMDLARRFSGADGELGWAGYRAALPAWRVRWLPYDEDRPARLYVAAGCDVCRAVRAFVEERCPVGLVICDAEDYPSHPNDEDLSSGTLGGEIRRMGYVAADGYAEFGVAAFARALEHVNFGWAFCGFLLRLPLICQTAQLLMDTAGFGPRAVCRRG